MSGRIRYARFPLCLLPALAVLAFVSCDGGDGGTPTSASSTPTALSISPPTDFLKVGQTESFSAQASMSNGSTQTVTATWGSDAPGVAAVESGGLIRGVSPGDATIWADYMGIRATRRLRVAPDYQGNWSGSYRVLGCSATGDWRDEGMCGELDLVGEVLPLMLRLSQNRTSVTGTIAIGDLMGDGSGDIGVSGILTLNGSVTFEEEGIRATITLADWSTTASGDGMTGNFTEVWTVTGFDGDMRLPCALETVQRTSTASLQTLGSAGRRVPAGGTLSQRLRSLVGATR